MAVMAEMMVYIGENLERGAVYETEIVIREDRHNQNICFKLYVNPVSEVPEAAPYDEREIDTHFHRWYYHYYCTPAYKRDLNMADLKDELVVKPADGRIEQVDQLQKSQAVGAEKIQKAKAKAPYISRKSKPKL
jgi:hypothetical protein